MTTRSSLVGRVVGLLVVALLLGACSTQSGFWDRSPRVASVRQFEPGSAAGSLPYAAPQPQGEDFAAPYEPPFAQPVRPPSQPHYEAVPVPADAAPTTTEESEVLARVNAIRVQRSLRPLRYHPTLYVAARDHSLEQQRSGRMSHGSSDPRRATIMQRMELAGYQGSVYAEVVAWGYTSAAGVVEGWMNSPDHRRILVDPELTEAAFSRVGAYWTGNFGAPRRQATGGPSTAARPPAARPAPAPRAAPPRRRPAPRQQRPIPVDPPAGTSGFG